MDPLTRSVCRSCRMRLRSSLPQARSFSTSTTYQIVPPESPNYVDVPTPFQAQLPWKRPQKGILPVPREVFPANRPEKFSPEYIENVNRDPLPHNVKPIEGLSKQNQYRARMTDLRKQHLREGLTELYKRKQASINKTAYQARLRFAERTRLAQQPEREDSRLTSNTIPQALRKIKSSTPVADDLAAAKTLYETKKANYERTVAAKQDTRLDALHTLYMNARSFITTPEQLDEAITREFDEQTFRSDDSEGRSIWNRGPPDTLKDMINNARGIESGSSSSSGMGALNLSGRREIQMNKQAYLRDQARMKKIAEKLSGGKI